MATAAPTPARNDAPPSAGKSNGHLNRRQPDGYGELAAAAASMFDRPELERLAPRLRSGLSLAELNGQGIHGLDPLAATEAIAYDFLAKGGKHSRPFITLAVFDALTTAGDPRNERADSATHLSDAVKRCALSIETFHKASLVHDDIEDDDEFRYGEQTLHRKFGVATAINVGDYLIGLGYRLVSSQTKTLGAEAVCDIIDRLANAHMKLSEGQGAELVWRDSRNKRLTPQDALKIYALKTAPAFEAALHTGIRLAGPSENYLEPMRQFARNLGIAFQIINDLNDWLPDDHNKLSAAGDLIGGRPTVLWALALEGLPAAEKARLEKLAVTQPLSEEILCEIRRLYEAAGVFEKAGQMVERYQHQAAAIAGQIDPPALRQLLNSFIDTVLERRLQP